MLVAEMHLRAIKVDQGSLFQDTEALVSTAAPLHTSGSTLPRTDTYPSGLFSAGSQSQVHAGGAVF